MLDKIKLRFYCPGDERDIIDLFALVYGKNISLDWWRWRYLGNAVAKPQVALAYSSGKLVAHYAVSPIILRCNGLKIKCAQSMTTMTHPEYEGRGLFVDLASSLYKKLYEDGYNLVFGFPNQNSHGIFNNKLSWKDIGIIATLYCDVGDLKVQDSSIEKVSYENVSQIVNSTKIFTSKNIHADMNSKYIKWRFSLDSGNTYKVVKTNSGGLVIFKHFGDSGMDIVHLAGDEKALVSMIKSLYNYAVDNRISKIATWCNLHSLLHVQLERLGFEPNGDFNYFGGIDLTKKNQFFDLRKWDLNMSLSDIF